MNVPAPSDPWLDSKTMRLVIPGVPIPLKRARAGKHGFYDSQYTAKKNMQWHIRVTYGEIKAFTVPLNVSMEFLMPIPKSFSFKKQDKLNNTVHIKKPDLTNLAKFYEDGFNEILWEDDSLIAEMSLKKIYSREPKTILTIKPLE